MASGSKFNKLESSATLGEPEIGIFKIKILDYFGIDLDDYNYEIKEYHFKKTDCIKSTQRYDDISTREPPRDNFKYHSIRKWRHKNLIQKLSSKGDVYFLIKIATTALFI
jgi:hypothetical protein